MVVVASEAIQSVAAVSEQLPTTEPAACALEPPEPMSEDEADVDCSRNTPVAMQVEQRQILSSTPQEEPSVQVTAAPLQHLAPIPTPGILNL